MQNAKLTTKKFNLIKNPKHRRHRVCERCKCNIDAHESYYIASFSAGGGYALDEYCMSCGDEMGGGESGDAYISPKESDRRL